MPCHHEKGLETIKSSVSPGIFKLFTRHILFVNLFDN